MSNTIIINNPNQVEKIGTILKKEREKQNLTQEWVAEKLGMRQNQLSSAENNKKLLRMPTVLRYIKILGIVVVFK